MTAHVIDGISALCAVCPLAWVAWKMIEADEDLKMFEADKALKALKQGISKQEISDDVDPTDGTSAH
jgi:hypothetical protein